MGKETAEQKLLKLIETPSSDPKAAGQEAASQIAQAVHSHGFLNSLLGFGKFFPGNAFHFSFGLREINRILLAAILGIFVFLLTDFLNGTKSLQKKVDLAVDSSAAKTSSNIIVSVKELSDYLSPLEDRNIFLPFEKKAVEEKTAEPPAPPKITAMTEKLKLVGVSWVDSAETASAMVEDQESGITYFVHQGEKVKDLTVKTIFANQVVLTYEGEEITIRL